MWQLWRNNLILLTINFNRCTITIEFGPLNGFLIKTVLFWKTCLNSQCYLTNSPPFIKLGRFTTAFTKGRQWYQINPVYNFPADFFNIHPSCSSRGPPTKMLFVHITSIRAMCPAHLILLGLSTLIIVAFQTRSLSLCSFLEIKYSPQHPWSLCFP